MDKFKSRKFWMVIIGALITVLNEGLGLNLPREALITIGGLIVSYVIGQGMQDAAKEKGKAIVEASKKN